MATAREANQKQGDARLDPEAWIIAAQALLAERGEQGVRVETLAKRLGVTKGSFYWHFKDRDALLAEMLAHWRRRATLNIIERIDSSRESAESRLRLLLRLPITGRASERGADVELSIRLWSRHDKRAQAALAEVDELRLRYLRTLIVESGANPDEAEARAVLAYCYMRVAASLVERERESLMTQCENLLMGR